ncbi:MAG: ABC transporter permease [Oscillospiraceae bacterium]|nr:ABC transporter permease [Oscillospiraceae bacterium]
MAKFIIKRVLAAVFTLFVVCTLTFFLMNMIPGGPFLSEKTSARTLEIVNEKYGLDKPLFEQYLNYMGRLLKGDLGVSFKKQGFTVNQIIAKSFPVSAGLGGIAILWSLALGLPLGVLAAMRRNHVSDRIVMFVCTLGISVPSFVIGGTLMYFIVEQLGLVSGIGLNSPSSYILPVLTLSFSPMSYIARLVRSTMLDVIGQDYIKTARAKGLSNFKVIFKHTMRNTLIPVITYLGPMTAGVLTGGFVVERIFSIPGLGRYFIDAISNRDYPMIMGTTIFFAAILIVANLIVDILYCVVDPRIKFE